MSYCFFSPGYVAGQFTAAPPICPGDTFTFQCTVSGDKYGVTLWRVGGLNECPLLHSTPDSHPCGNGSPFTAMTGTEFGKNASSYSSTLSGTATPTLDGTLVECFGPDFNRDSGNMVGHSTLQILGQLTSLPQSVCKYAITLNLFTNYSSK